MSKPILIAGATGFTGGHTARYLLQQGIPVRALVHRIDQRSEKLLELGAEIVVGDLLDLNQVSVALQGIRAAFFVYPITHPGVLEATALFVQGAKENDVEHIVNLSQFGAHRDARSHGAQNHWIAERLLERSGVGFTQLRPTLFAEWFLYQAAIIRSQQKFMLPFGTARFAPIATQDIGRVAATILADPSLHTGKSYELFGPVILSMEEVATAFSHVLQRNIQYVPVSGDQFAAVVEEFLKPHPYFLQHVRSLGQDLSAGRAAGLNTLVEDLTGTVPMDMESFIANNRSAFS